MRSISPTTYILSALALFNLCVKLLWLGTNELAHDEPFTVFQAQRGLSDLFSLFRTENNPPFYFLLMHVWSDLVPLDASWLRVPSALFSALTVWPLFLLARSLGGSKVAVVASLLFTFNNSMYGHAHEVRAYALFALLAASSMWQLWRLANDEERARLWLIVFGTLMVYTHFFGWLLLGVELVVVIGLKEFRPARRAFMLALGVIVLAYLPYATTFWGRLGASVEQGTWLQAPVPEELYNMIWRWSNAPVLAMALLIVIILSGFRGSMKDPAFKLGLVWTLLPLLGMFAASYIAPMFLDRYLIYAAPGFYVLAASALCGLIVQHRWSTALGAFMVLGMAITFTPWKGNGLHPSSVVQQAMNWRNDGPVIVQPAHYDLTYAWHLDPALFSDPETLQEALFAKGIFPVNNVQDLSIDLDDHKTVVLIDAWASLTDPKGELKQLLRSHFPDVDSTEADKKVWVYRYSDLVTIN